jgi:hypothetical protein
VEYLASGGQKGFDDEDQMWSEALRHRRQRRSTTTERANAAEGPALDVRVRHLRHRGVIEDAAERMRQVVGVLQVTWSPSGSSTTRRSSAS